MYLSSKDCSEGFDAAAGRLSVDVSSGGGSRISNSIWLSGTILSMERHRAIHRVCQNHCLLNYFGNKVPSSGNTKRHFHGYKNLSFVGYDGIDSSFESDSFDLVVTRYAF